MCPHCAFMAFLIALPVVGGLITWWRMRKVKKGGQTHEASHS